jgi:protein SCO1/2
MTRVIALFAAAAVLIGLAAGFFFVIRAQNADTFAECRRSVVAGGSATIGGPFTLVDTDGNTVTDADVITGPTLVYFGYAFCPDFCPTDLARNAWAKDLLAERGQAVGLVFVTIDPERDTPEILADFREAIHPELVALTGTPEQVAAAANAYRVYFRKNGDDPEFYLMDHSTFTYLVDPAQGFLEFYPSTLGAQEMADSVGCYVSKL